MGHLSLSAGQSAFIREFVLSFQIVTLRVKGKLTLKKSCLKIDRFQKSKKSF